MGGGCKFYLSVKASFRPAINYSIWITFCAVCQICQRRTLKSHHLVESVLDWIHPVVKSPLLLMRLCEIGVSYKLDNEWLIVIKFKQ